MVDHAQAEVAAEPAALTSLGARHGLVLGLQARTGSVETLRVGDAVTLRHSRPAL